MTLFTSGDWQVDVSDFNTDRFTTHALFDFMCERFPILKDADVEVNQVDLTNEYGYGFCQVDEDGEFLIHIHNDLTPENYAITLIHELVHVKQTCDGLLNYDRREEEAVIWEKILSKELWDNFQSDTFYGTPWKSDDRIYVLNPPSSPLFSTHEKS